MLSASTIKFGSMSTVAERCNGELVGISYGCPMVLTRRIGVSLRIFIRILCTSSPSPDMQTFVTKPWGRMWRACVAFGSEEVTRASNRPPLSSLICLHSLLRFSTLLACTGSLCIGEPSGVLAGIVQRWKAPGLLWRISSTSGPARVDAKGTLNDRFAVESVGVV